MNNAEKTNNEYIIFKLIIGNLHKYVPDKEIKIKRYINIYLYNISYDYKN